MVQRTSARGVTLVETLVAVTLLSILAAGLVPLLLLTHRLVERAELSVTATAAAASQVERLLALPWDYGADGEPREVSMLAWSPVGSLDADLPGHVDRLDQAGRVLDAGDTHPPVLLRRWAVHPVPGFSSETRAVEACVFQWPVTDGDRPLVCVGSARVRQP